MPRWEPHTADPATKTNRTPGWPPAEVWRERLMGKIMVDEEDQEADPETTFKRSDLPKEVIVHGGSQLALRRCWLLHIYFNQERLENEGVKVVERVFFQGDNASPDQKAKLTEPRPWKPDPEQSTASHDT